MQAKIQVHFAREVSGVGIVMQFVVLEGVIKPGMQAEFQSIKLKAGNKMVAYKDVRMAKRDLKEFVHYPEAECCFISEAKSTDGYGAVQVNFPVSDAKKTLEILAQNKDGIFIFADLAI